MPTPVTNDPKTPVSPPAGGPAPASMEAPQVSDNLSFQSGVVVDPNSNRQTPPDEIPEEIPALATPAEFTKKKKAVSEPSISYFELLLAQSKSSYENRVDSMKAQQKNLGNMQKAQKESAKEMDKKVDEQADKQAKSAAKSGFLSIFSKVFTVITALVGVAMLFVPGLQVAGVLMLAGVAVSIATQIPGVMEGLGKIFTAILTPILGKELAEKWGPIVAAIYVAGVQIALAVGSFNVAKVGEIAMKTVATVIKFVSSSSGMIQGAVQGGVGMALGFNNMDLADITKAVDSLTNLNDLLNTQIQQYIETINQNYQQLTNDQRRASNLINDYPTYQVA
jgi:hypothetical protein